MTTPDNKKPEDYNLPWLVNNTLSADEHTATEQAIAQSPELQDDKDFLEALRKHVKTQALPSAPKELAWQRLKRDIRADKKTSQHNNFWRFSAIAATLVVVAQTAFITLPGTDTYSGYEMLSSEISTPVLRIKFTDNATAAEIQALLTKHELRIIDGPSASGLYTITGSKDPHKTLKSLREESNLIDHAQVD